MRAVDKRCVFRGSFGFSQDKLVDSAHDEKGIRCEWDDGLATSHHSWLAFKNPSARLTHTSS